MLCQLFAKDLDGVFGNDISSGEEEEEPTGFILWMQDVK